MLVGKYYQKFLDDGRLTQIDAAANLIMEKVYDDELEREIADDFIYELNHFIGHKRYFILQPKVDALYLSVLYNLYKDKRNRSRAKKFFNEEGGQYRALLRTDDSAEAFCQSIEEILTRIG